MGMDAGQRFCRMIGRTTNHYSEAPMLKTERPAAAIQINLAAIFVPMELSRSTWLITALLPGNG